MTQTCFNTAVGDSRQRVDDGQRPLLAEMPHAIQPSLDRFMLHDAQEAQEVRRREVDLRHAELDRTPIVRNLLGLALSVRCRAGNTTQQAPSNRCGLLSNNQKEISRIASIEGRKNVVSLPASISSPGHLSKRECSDRTISAERRTLAFEPGAFERATFAVVLTTPPLSASECLTETPAVLFIRLALHRRINE
jgi:hypothetical protein